MVKYYIFIAILGVVVIGIVVVGFIIAGNPISKRNEILKKQEENSRIIQYDYGTYTPPTPVPTLAPLPTHSPDPVTGSYVKGITNGTFEDPLKGWSVAASGNADALVDNGRLRLRIYQCSYSEAQQTFQIHSNKLSFDWQTKAEGWWENPGWELLVDGNVATGEAFPVPDYSSTSGKKEINTSKYIDKIATLHFKIKPGDNCASSDHENTYLWIDNVL